MSMTWDLDFYSRPILDDQDKKLWEVLICDSQRRFEYAQYCPGSQANARWLAGAMESAMVQWREVNGLATTATPDKVRYFRRPMMTIIERAGEMLNLSMQPSRRTFALYQWLQERNRSIYPSHPGYQPLMPAPTAFEKILPQTLPEALRGEGWGMVSLTGEDLAQMRDWSITFADEVPLDLATVPPETVIPGLVIYSQRAIPLAGWMSGLELSALVYEDQPTPRLILETGLSDRWTLATLGTPALVKEARTFQAQQQAADNLHFLAVQSNPKSQEFAGFWVLQELGLD
jgi:hypothetical protein